MPGSPDAHMEDTPMLTNEERKRFRALIIINGITMHDWCKSNRFNYNSFRASFNGHQKMAFGSEDAARKYIKSNGMEIDQVAAAQDDTEFFAKKRRDDFDKKVAEALARIKEKKRKGGIPAPS